MTENTIKRSSFGLFLWLALHAACGAAVLWLLLKLVPQYEKIFKDFNTKLPDLTIAVINLARWVGMFWYLLVPALAAADFAIITSLHRAGRTGLLAIWGVLVLLCGMLMSGVILEATLVPLNDLITRLSGGN